MLQNLFDALGAFTKGWTMSFQSMHYLLFLPIVVGAFFAVPVFLRRPWLLLASLYFYFFAAPKYLGVLVVGILFSWLVGLAIGGAKTAGARRGWLAFGVTGMVAALAFFKYNDFFAGFLAPLFEGFGISYLEGYFVTAGAVGISFYTFMAIGYLVDLSRGDVPVEKNLLTHALFLGFFPAVSSGPISRAGGLMPQLRELGQKFDPQNAADALRLMAIGFFKKMAVADMLAVFVKPVFEEYAGYGGLTLLAAAVLFVLQLYFDFSGYTDIALGSAQLLGIKLPQNFQNPYFATNFSGFWARWHMSLSSWLQDYIFTPLVWSRWPERLPLVGKHVKKPPVLSSIAIVFLISGVWHGDTLCFLVWGALMAAYRIGEEILHRTLGKPKKRLPAAKRAGKTAVVLALWCVSLVFFRMGMPTTGGAATGTVADALAFLGGMFGGFSPAALWADMNSTFLAGLYNSAPVAPLLIGFTLVCTAVALWADWVQNYRLKNGSLVAGMKALRPLPRWALYYFLVLCCYAGFVAQGSGSFLYGGF